MNKKIPIIVIAALLLLPSVLQAQEWYETYEKGRDAFNQQRWQEAIRYLTDVIAEKSDSKANARTYGLQFIDYFPYVYRGIAYYKLQDRANALADLEKAENEGVVSDGKKDTEAQRLLREYLPLARKTETKPPAQPQTDPVFAEGLRLYNGKDYKGAVDQFKAVSPNSPQRAEAVRYMGLAQNEMRKIEAAATLKDRNDRIEKAFSSGVQYFNQNNLDRAEEEFTAVLQLDGSHAEARQYLDRIKTLRQKASAPPVTAKKETPKESTREPARTVEKPPIETAAQVMFREAVSLYGDGRISQARVKFQTLKGLDPSSQEVEGYLQKIAGIEAKTREGITAFFEGQYQQAIDRLRETSTSVNDNPHVYAFLACSYAARYLLTGAEDNTLHQNAVEAFNRMKLVDAHYSLDGQIISPKIVALLNGQ